MLKYLYLCQSISELNKTTVFYKKYDFYVTSQVYMILGCGFRFL